MIERLKRAWFVEEAKKHSVRATGTTSVIIEGLKKAGLEPVWPPTQLHLEDENDVVGLTDKQIEVLSVLMALTSENSSE